MPVLDDPSCIASVVVPLLQAEPLASLKLQGTLHYGAVDEIRVDNLTYPSAVVLRSGVFYEVFGVDAGATHRVLKELDWSTPLAFSAVWEPLVAIVADCGRVHWEHTCTQYQLPESETLEDELFAIRGEDAHLVQPSEEDVGVILGHWPPGSSSAPTDLAHIRERVATGMTSGWVEDHHLVSWAMIHPDGSLGYLHTLPDYRGKGIDRRVLADLALKVWNTGHTPYAHITCDDAPAPLLEELGLMRHPDRFYWLGMRPRR